MGGSCECWNASWVYERAAGEVDVDMAKKDCVRRVSICVGDGAQGHIKD